jgi:hypothetical protein
MCHIRCDRSPRCLSLRRAVGSIFPPRGMPTAMVAPSIAFVTHVADEYLIAGMAALDLRFEEAKVHHPRTQAIPKQDEPGVFFEFQRFRCRAREECKGKTRERREKEKKCLAGGFHVVDWSGDRRMSDIHAFEHRDFGFSWRPRRGRLRLRPRRHRWFVFAHCWR